MYWCRYCKKDVEEYHDHICSDCGRWLPCVPEHTGPLSQTEVLRQAHRTDCPRATRQPRQTDQ